MFIPIIPHEPKANFYCQFSLVFMLFSQLSFLVVSHELIFCDWHLTPHLSTITMMFIKNSGDRSSPTCVLRQALTKYFLHIFHQVSISNPFPYIKWFLRVVMKRESRYRSVVIQFSAIWAREFNLSKWCLLAHSKLRDCSKIARTVPKNVW